MRTTKDRIRQAISFEAIGIMFSVPLAAFTFDFDLGKTGALGIVGASLATIWNYVFNLVFDLGLKKLNDSTQKSLRTRLLHAISFELGLMVMFLPIIAWWMGIGLVDALIVDLAFIVFYLVYTFVFTWSYDTIFPDPDGKDEQVTADSG
ncbi:hypothetical protein BKP64_11115 [Marinobacter salinus]|uniref:Chlorhexidine efflux transporter domain-containing protein n=1 Tax=Marinobacter salinus TaxID=1874317 RepID=A0A1D9GM18_9GAMM|nr:PACE efflux transporter [Marinobacter salinus]AOY88677.1 hypothetical protein BKP64_11115 [Marinobacter salinus]